ncbi:MAG: hypothetical protein IIY87_02655 [Bacteroidales bacterium]|jgi:hypothetical protein|nr:hypothetical protein [Bacteroidales bacterium]
MKLFRKILGGLSLTTAMFVFQACYGTMSSAEIDIVEDIVDSMDEAMDEEDEVETLEVTSTLKASDSLACDE